MAAISNLYIDQGSTFSAIITIRGSDGNPLNLTSYSVASQIRKSYGSTTAYNFNASVYDASTGKVRLQLTAAQSSAMRAGRYLYDVEITLGDYKSRVAEGLVTITPEITKV